MTETIDADDLAMLATGFEAALVGTEDPAVTTAKLYDLGWAELLAAAPWHAVATAFPALGATASAAAIVDDVLAHALGIDLSLTTCVVLPAPHRSTAPGQRTDGPIVVDGIVSRRVDQATTAVLAIEHAGSTDLATVDASLVRGPHVVALDPGAAYRRVQVELDAGDLTAVHAGAPWSDVVGLARTALAHELIATSRTMLDHAREHAVDRVQFGRPVAGFQAVRHKLAESLVHIEAAVAVAETCDVGADTLVPALAKSLAGKAARTTATHAQQVLAGIGFTTEHPFHRFLKRSLVVDTLFGSASSLPTEIGAELLRRGGAPRLVEL